jgi:exonuclease V gamma subunit
LNADHQSSWKEGCKRLVEALVTTTRINHLTIDFSEADVLSRWITVLEQFQGINEGEKTLTEWSKNLKFLVDRFFAPDLDDDLMRGLENFSKWTSRELIPFQALSGF